ncbi:MAG: UDP-N-acetylglucosamine 2-epimerase (non-hydrolyzing) [Rhodopirellula sp.]|nr:UDP-N-acetylglucosamine 2-epimerase (non-hydrolyzing) [Rhodopirellula sp.]
MVLIDLISGARPNFMKIASIIKAIEIHQKFGGRLRYRLVHTGQHYDTKMSGDFFEQLHIPLPDVNLNVGSGTQAEQTASIMVRYEELLKNATSNLCLVVGDVTSTMACAITAQKLGIPIAHVEAGIRSGDWSMPEEINRLVTDSITNWFFTTSIVANTNLRNSGVPEDRIFFVGNTMIDTLLANQDRFAPPDFWKEMELQEGKYFLLTLHRPSNVDQLASLNRILNVISEGAKELPVVFPVHPRTYKTLRDIDQLPMNIIIVEPQPYLQFNYLSKFSIGIITDSGGITEEATVLNIPCVTLRDSTERPETVSIGTNELVGLDPTALLPYMNQIIKGHWKQGAIPERWDGQAGNRIVEILNNVL